MLDKNIEENFFPGGKKHIGNKHFLRGDTLSGEIVSA